MKPPLLTRPLAAAEVRELAASLRSHDAFTLRRSQILLASARGSRPSQIAEYLGCDDQTVRNALRAFRREGLGCLTAKSQAPHRSRPSGRRRATMSCANSCTRARGSLASPGAPGRCS